DLNLIAFAHLGGVKRHALQHDQVVFDGHTPRIDLEVAEQHSDRPWTGDFERIAVQQDLHGFASRRPRTKAPTGKSDCTFPGSRRGSVELPAALLVAAGCFLLSRMVNFRFHASTSPRGTLTCSGPRVSNSTLYNDPSSATGIEKCSPALNACPRTA